MKILSAIILLMWVTCYGRCLAEQYGLLAGGTPLSCQHLCCEDECPAAPAPEPSPDCEVCDFINTGGVSLGHPLVLAAPALFHIPSPESVLLTRQPTLTEAMKLETATVDTGPPPVLRMCEWLACTATPVRGPNTGV